MCTTPIPVEAVAFTKSLLRESVTPGAAIALKIDDLPVASVEVGTTDIAGAQPMPSNAEFPLYSITKTLLAVASLRLVDSGRLSLDDEPSVAGLPDGITLRHLLAHTAGLADYGALPEYASDLRADPSHPWSDQEFLARTLGRGPLFAPGEGWAYSNIGYLFVRRIVEDIGGGGELGTALQQLVFGPAGVPGMRVARTQADLMRLSPGYSNQVVSTDDVVDIRSRYHPGWVSHGLVTATAGDTARLMAALFDGRLLAPRTLDQMLRGVPVGGHFPPFGRAGYGLGLMIDLDSEVHLIAGHAGGGPGYSTAAFRFESAEGKRVTCVAFVNRDAGDTGLRIAFATARIALGLLG